MLQPRSPEVLAAAGYLLDEDLPRVEARAAERGDAFHGVAGAMASP